MRKDKVVSTSNREIAILLTASFFSIGNQGGPPFDLLQSFVRGGPAHLTCNRLANLPTTMWLQSAERTALGGNRVLTNRQPKPRSWPADVSATNVTLGVDASNSACAHCEAAISLVDQGQKREKLRRLDDPDAPMIFQP